MAKIAKPAAKTEQPAAAAPAAPKSLRERAASAQTREEMRAVLVELVDITAALTISPKLAKPSDETPAS